MKHFFIIFAAILALTACQSDGTDEPSDYVLPARRTVIVYMSAENNLNSFAQYDINELIKGRKNVGADCDLILFVDKASKTEMPFIARIRNKTDQPVDTLYQYPTDFYASDSDHFKEVLQRIIALSPAKDYGLVFWGHASGWIMENDGVDYIRRAYGPDNGDNTTDKRWVDPTRWLNIPTMAKVLKDLNVHFSFLFFDCCNMQTAEVAYELRNATDYIIASPAEITGEGAPYDTLVKDFYIEDGEQMSIVLCKDYNAQLDYVGGHLPIGAVKTAAMPQLAAATKLILPEVADYLKTDNPTQDMIYYFAYNKRNDYEKTMYDMYGIIRAALAEAPEKFSTWEAAFHKAVFHAEFSAKWHAETVNFNDFTATAEKFGGMSMFFPLEKYKLSVHPYNDDIKLMQWYQAVGWSEVGW